MLIGQAADQIIRELGYQTVEKKLDRRNVIRRLDAERSQLMGILSQGGTIQGDQYIVNIRTTPQELPDIFYVTKNTPVIFDTTKQRFTAIMPTEYVMLINNNGIRVIKPLQDTVGSTYMINQRAGASVLYGSLDSASLGGMVGFELEGQHINFNNMPANTYSYVSVTYIPTLSGLREDDIMPCTGDFLSVLLDKTRDAFLIQKATPQDLTIDNKSN